MLDKKYFEKGYTDLQFYCGGDDGLEFSFEDLEKKQFKTKRDLCKFLKHIITDYWRIMDECAFDYGYDLEITEFEELLFLYSLLEYYKEEGAFQ